MVSTTREDSFGVEMHDDGAGWRVVIVGPDGAVLAERTCRDRTEASTYASTVRQHIYWLSPERFRAYYRL
jgi:hypothetical protein